jgi:hypothetical protein
VGAVVPMPPDRSLRPGWRPRKVGLEIAHWGKFFGSVGHCRKRPKPATRGFNWAEENGAIHVGVSVVVLFQE